MVAEHIKQKKIVFFFEFLLLIFTKLDFKELTSRTVQPVKKYLEVAQRIEKLFFLLLVFHKYAIFRGHIIFPKRHFTESLFCRNVILPNCCLAEKKISPNVI